MSVGKRVRERVKMRTRVRMKVRGRVASPDHARRTDLLNTNHNSLRTRTHLQAVAAHVSLNAAIIADEHLRRMALGCQDWSCRAGDLDSGLGSRPA